MRERERGGDGATKKKSEKRKERGNIGRNTAEGDVLKLLFTMAFHVWDLIAFHRTHNK